MPPEVAGAFSAADMKVLPYTVGMLSFLYDLWIVWFDREPAPKTWSELIKEVEKRHPNDRYIQQWNAEYELQRRKEMGTRQHDA